MSIAEQIYKMTDKEIHDVMAELANLYGVTTDSVGVKIRAVSRDNNYFDENGMLIE
jgi:hypothetical protein